MKIIPSSKIHHYVKRLSIFLIIVALIAGMVGCDGGESYALAIISTAGGSVTTPGEGIFIYDAGTVVDLVATPDVGYCLVNWTGDVDTIANVNAAATKATTLSPLTLSRAKQYEIGMIWMGSVTT